jgi:hypothetical protein
MAFREFNGPCIEQPLGFDERADVLGDAADVRLIPIHPPLEPLKRFLELLSDTEQHLSLSSNGFAQLERRWRSYRSAHRRGVDRAKHTNEVLLPRSWYDPLNVPCKLAPIANVRQPDSQTLERRRERRERRNQLTLLGAVDRFDGLK